MITLSLMILSFVHSPTILIFLNLWLKVDTYLVTQYDRKMFNDARLEKLVSIRAHLCFDSRAPHDN